MTMFYHPVDRETDRKIREQVVTKLVERSKRNFEALLELPGMEKTTGRERLAFYRQTEPAYWEELAASYPQIAKAALMDWSSLVTRYGAEVPL